MCRFSKAWRRTLRRASRRCRSSRAGDAPAPSTPVLVEMPVHVREESHGLKARLLQHATRCGICGMHERPDHGEPKLPLRELEAEPRQLGRKTSAPGDRREAIADLGAPARIERVVIKTPEAHDPFVALAAHGPGAVAKPFSLAFVTGDVTATGPEIRQTHRVLHGVGIAKKRQQLRRI